MVRNKPLKFNKPMIMGILNVTPDSFSDGGLYNSIDKAFIQAQKMIKDGADIIDIGGESTRPNAQEISEAEELDRVIPIIEKLAKENDIKISIDTSKANVMKSAVKAGANMINDVYALQKKNALKTVAELGINVCLMHMQGSPKNMQNNPFYNDVIKDVMDFLKRRVADCIAHGIDKNKIIIDPGFGFGKTYQHNLELLRNLAKFKELNLPILVGLSRKSMFKDMLGIIKPQKRITSSVVAAMLAFKKGANIVRVHDVKQTKEALIVLENIYG